MRLIGIILIILISFFPEIIASIKIHKLIIVPLQWIALAIVIITILITFACLEYQDAKNVLISGIITLILGTVCTWKSRMNRWLNNDNKSSNNS